MTASEDIIDKVRKLLRLAQSGNPHEAGLALERALQIAAKHKIEVATLDLDPEIERILHQKFPIGQRLSYISKLTLNVVVAFFHVEVVVSKPDVIFAGTATDVAIAHYIFGFLTGSCARALKTFENEKRRRPSLIRRQNFIAGWIYGVRSQLDRAQEKCAIEDSQFALVVAEQSKRREQYMQDLIPNTRKMEVGHPRRLQTAAMAGFAEGRTTPIRTPLKAGSPVLALT